MVTLAVKLHIPQEFARPFRLLQKVLVDDRELPNSEFLFSLQAEIEDASPRGQQGNVLPVELG